MTASSQQLIRRRWGGVTIKGEGRGMGKEDRGDEVEGR